MYEAMKTEEQPQEKLLEIIFLNEKEAIKANDLQGFLFYFNMYYLKLVDEYNITVIDIDINSLIDNSNDYTDSFYFSKSDYIKYSRKIYSEENDLKITKLEKHSPLEIVFAGSITALVIALILSGGKVEIDVFKGKFKATINQSLGKSLKELIQIYKNY